MKKKYVEPSSKVIKINAEEMICQSPGDAYNDPMKGGSGDGEDDIVE